MGEFGWKEILKQFLDDERAKKVAAAWNGDDYATFEQKDTKQLMVFARVRFDSPDNSGDFFKAYSEALAKKYTQQKSIMNGEKFLAFDSSDGHAYLRCVRSECVTAQGTDAATFSNWTNKLGWPSAALTAQRHLGREALPGVMFSAAKDRNAPVAAN